MGYIGSAVLAGAAVLLVFVARRLTDKMQEANDPSNQGSRASGKAIAG